MEVGDGVYEHVDCQEQVEDELEDPDPILEDPEDQAAEDLIEKTVDEPSEDASSHGSQEEEEVVVLADGSPHTVKENEEVRFVQCKLCGETFDVKDSDESGGSVAYQAGSAQRLGGLRRRSPG